MAEPIAIVGWGGLFPGGQTPQSLWSNLRDGIDVTSEPPPGRWVLPADSCQHDDPGRPDRVYSSRAGFVTQIEVPWDSLHIEPRHVGDPLEQLVLAAGAAAWSSAVTEPVDRQRVGLALGNIVLPTQGASQLCDSILGRAFVRDLERTCGTALPDVLGFDGRATDRWVAGRPAGLLAQALGLGGPQWSLDAACASSLFALELAVRALQAHRIDAALAGGASRPDPLYTQMGFSQLRALSNRGRCSPFDAAADGLVVGEGAGLFVLKRLGDALDHGDTIRAVITGIGVSNDIDGRLLAPSVEGQLRAMRAAYAEAGWTPSDVDLVECHATGTPTGDAVEFASLCALWKDAPARQGAPCALGAVKANVGHLLTGAGAAALAKVLLCIEHEQIAPVANFSTPSPRVPLADSPLSIPTQARPWTSQGRPRRAALSGFGFGGTNAHVLLQDRAPASPKVQVAVGGPAPRPGCAAAVIGLGGHVGPWRGAQALFPRLLGAGAPAEPTAAPAFGGLPDPPRGHFIETIEVERGAFSIPPRELEACLPQQILMLDVAEQAWIDAGQPDLAGPRTGVYIGVGLDLGTTDYYLRWALRRRAPKWAQALGRPAQGPDYERWVDALADAIAPPLDANRTMGGLGSVVASRVARRFRIGGPSYVLSTEEGSGLAAVDAALDALRRGVIDRAMVGAVDLTSDVRALLSNAATTGISTRSFTAALSDQADGSIPADGAIALILQRETDADPDLVYAVVEGIGGSSGGRPQDFAPDPDAYARSVAQALEDADVDPSEVGWVVAHGSGRAGADAAEIQGIARALREVPTVSAPTALVGNCGAASGLVSLAQACVGVGRRVLAGTPGQRHRRGGLRTAGATPRPWLIDRDRQHRRALVASYGAGGACHHVVVRAPRRDGSRTETLESLCLLPPDAEALFAIEGDDVSEIETGLSRLVEIGSDAAHSPATRLARGWASEHGRQPSTRLGLCIIARTGAQLAQLAQLAMAHLGDPASLSKQTAGRVVATEPGPPEHGPGELAFVFPGSGNHFVGMGRTLGLHFPAVLRELEVQHRRVHSQVQDHLLWDGTRDQMDADPRGLILGQVGFGTISAAVLTRFGVRPQAAIGYSLGETTALFAHGAWRARDEMLRRAEASHLFSEQLAGPCLAARRTWELPDDVDVQWTVGVIESEANAVRAALPDAGRVALLIVNTPTQCVIGGHRPDVEDLTRRLGVRLHRLEGITTVHCEVVQPVAEDYRDFHRLPTTPPPGLRFYSGAWGESYAIDQERAAASITACAVDGIDFPRTIARAYEDGVRHFVEIGPGSSCTRMIDAILGDRPHCAVSLSFPGADERGMLLRALATLLTHRLDVDLGPLHSRPRVAPWPSPRTPHRIRVGRSGPGSVPSLADAAPAPAAAAPTPARVPHNAALPFVGPAGTTAAAHDVFLRLSATRQRLATTLLSQTLPLAHRLPPDLVTAGFAAANDPPPRDPILNREQCRQFAIGSIGSVFGAQFAPIDAFATRVRLPDDPLMLVDRVTDLEGEPLGLGAGRIVTEHDVRPGCWYLDADRIPTAVLIESGQADLMLSAWLGIDFETRGNSMYRLLDATVTFSGALPRVGQTIRHDIRIERFFQQAGTWLFRFHFESTVDGAPLVSMQDGCAGFFSPQQLADGQGVVQGTLETTRPVEGSWTPPLLVQAAPTTMDTTKLEALRRGDLVSAFGPAFAGLGVEQPLTIPSGKLRLLDRVTALQPQGGVGLGRIYGEYDVSPSDWFLTCHFVDDHVMPGTLMYECCLHTLRVLLLQLGWVADARAAAFEPVIGIKSRLRCRGQVLPDTAVVGYEVIVRRFVEGPEPAVVCDARMYADGKWIVDIGDMSVRLSGTTWTELRSRWSSRASHGPADDELGPDARPALYDRDRILSFAQGKPSDAFGAPYLPFDQERKIARLPGPPFSFIDRITAVTGDPFVMQAGASVEAQVEVPLDAWYFEANRQAEIPLCVLLEMALQPCGWLAAYVGSALTAPQRLRFRNLGGEATLLGPVEPGDLLTMRAKLTAVSHAGGMIIQHFDFDVLAQGRCSVYRGTTYFGFFTDEALGDQVGIREAVVQRPAGAATECFAMQSEAPFPRARLRMLEQIDVLHPAGGRHDLGFVEGHCDVHPDAWFFAAHFHEDPVWPGSLGLESFIQLLKAWAVKRWSLGAGARFSTAVLGAPQRWSYRGQVTPDRERVTVQASIAAVDGDPRSAAGARVEAEGFLRVDGRTIYQIDQLGLTVHAAESAP